MTQYIRSKKLLRAAKDAPCMGWCGKGPGCAVACHANWEEYGKGGKLKSHDVFIAYLCQDCNGLIDHASRVWTGADRKAMWVRAHARTLLYLFQQGLVRVA